MENSSISVVIPSYGRPRELEELLLSICNQEVPPCEVVLLEDCSPEANQIVELCASLSDEFIKKKIKYFYSCNEYNIGYDANLRKCIDRATSRWAMIMGNDDFLLCDGIKNATEYLKENNYPVVSRSFLRFKSDINRPLGISKLNNADCFYKINLTPSFYLFRCAAFIGGLIVDVEFGKKLKTEKYDGSLYYQIYLAATAFCTSGIGYINKPIIAGRTGNPPLFGSANNELEFHVPGAYTARSRAKMWKGVLEIIADVEKHHNVSLTGDIKYELMTRQSFHVFEMNAGASFAQLNELRKELIKLDIFYHPLPIFLFTINLILRHNAAFVYSFMRKVFQR